MNSFSYLENLLRNMKIDYSEEKLIKIYKFYNMVIDKNKVMNLTAITEHDDFMKKHIADSLAVLMFDSLHDKDRVLDLGTGGGFPGIPLKIFLPDKEFLLVDSVNKKLVFIQSVINELELKGISVIHGRAEDLAHDPIYREKFDVVVSRAVANLSSLTELSMGFIKTGGKFISYKGASGEDELNNANKTISVMGGVIEKTEKYELSDGDRRIMIFIRKEKICSKKYPRKAGIPVKNPL